MPKQVPLGVETLQRDSTALFSFVDSICSNCSHNPEAPAYLGPSLLFFEYIHELGNATKAYLNVFPTKAPRDERLYQEYRQKLQTIRNSWVELHKLIKPVVDADTLHIPYTLIEALTRRLNLVKGFEKTSFAIFHSYQLNYFEVELSGLGKITDRLSAIIPDAPNFPKIGLIGIPYSQASSLYLNVLISHEMGHFVFQQSELKEKLLSDIEQAIGNEFKGDKAWSKDRLVSWAEELFCDLFATWLIGPIYSLMYVELFGLTTILDPSAPRGFSITELSSSFSRSHPAHIFRLNQQVNLLQTLHWWSEIDAINSHYIDVLRAATAIRDTDLKFETREMKEEFARETLQAFLRLAKRLAAVIAEVNKDSKDNTLDSGVKDFGRFGTLICQYLEKAVVPSTVFVDPNHFYPGTVSLLNASMKFYLESLDKLIRTIKDQQSWLPAHRSKWIKRVELLTAKALEDYNLLVTEKGAMRDGGSFKRADLNPPKSSDH
jgi:hypothetical protein